MTTLRSTAIPRIMKPKPAHGGAPSHSPPDTRYAPGNKLARFLGYFSIGLGVAEVLAPRAMSRLTGVRQQRLLQAYGLREIAAGMGILNSSRSTEWMWARVAGDVFDLGTLGENLVNGRRPGRTLAATLAVVGVTALDVLCGLELSAAAALTDD